MEKNTNKNPINGNFLDKDVKTSLQTIKRVDENGFLFQMQCAYNYYQKSYIDLILSFPLDFGCSAFTMFNQNKEYVFCRNYDYRHNDENNKPTGCNLLITCAPLNKLKSIAMCDAYFLNPHCFYQGALDDGKTDISILSIAPFACVDGMNEAGVSAAIFALDVKSEAGEKPAFQNTGKEKVIHSILLRYILDNAHDVKEAIAIAKSYDLVNPSTTDGHIMVTDQSGSSAILEWRQFKGEKAVSLHVTYSNVITNFYVGFDDAQDMYYANGTLREKFSKLMTTWNEYRYGYGHGYHRFSGIVSALDRYTNENSVAINGVKQAELSEEQAKNILSVAAQEPGFEKTSYTQFSCLYNNSNKTLKLYSQRDYTKTYLFSFNF